MSKYPTKLRIAILTDDFYPHSGGVARSIELQINELSRAGHKVTLFAPKTYLNPPKNCDYQALDVWRLPGTPSYLCSVKFSRRLAEDIAAKYQFDIIHSQNERGSLFLGSRLAHLMHIPHVHTFHSNYAATHHTSPLASALNSLIYLHLAPLIMRLLNPHRTRNKVFLPQHLEAGENSFLARSDWKNVAKLASYTDAFSSPAQFMIDALLDASRGTLSKQAFVVPNGISPIFSVVQRRRPSEETLRFLCCCRLDPEKRVDVLINAFALLELDNAELYIVGSGSQLVKLKRLSERAVKHGRVVFRGKYDDVELLAQEYADADAFVLTSYRFDTQGMVLAEAAAAGTPIVYCDDRLKVGVSPQNALLVDPSAEAIAEGMRKLADNPALIKEMSAASRKVGIAMSATAMMEKYIDVYQQALNRQPLIQLKYETPQFHTERS